MRDGGRVKGWYEWRGDMTSGCRWKENEGDELGGCYSCCNCDTISIISIINIIIIIIVIIIIIIVIIICSGDGRDSEGMIRSRYVQMGCCQTQLKNNHLQFYFQMLLKYK